MSHQKYILHDLCGCNTDKSPRTVLHIYKDFHSDAFGVMSTASEILPAISQHSASAECWLIFLDKNVGEPYNDK